MYIWGDGGGEVGKNCLYNEKIVAIRPLSASILRPTNLYMMTGSSWPNAAGRCGDWTKRL